MHPLNSVSHSYRGGRGGSEEFVLAGLVVSALVWTTEPFLRAGAGVGFGGLAEVGAEPSPGGFGAVTGAAAVGLAAGAGVGSGGVGEAAVGLGARVGAGGGKKNNNKNTT